MDSFWQKRLQRSLAEDKDILRMRSLRIRSRRGTGENGRRSDRACPACKTPDAFEKGVRWFRPPGFAHPVEMEAELPLGDSPTPTRPTRAKLSAPFTDGRASAKISSLSSYRLTFLDGETAPRLDEHWLPRAKSPWLFILSRLWAN